MTRSALLWTAVGLFLALVVGCQGPRIHGNWSPSHWSSEDDKPIVAVARLDCPEHEGDLIRASTAPDGRVCVYRGEDGAEVELQLAALDGRPAEAVLEPIEAQLRGLVPPPPADTAAVQALADDNRAEVRLPGITISSEGEKAHVRLPGGVTIGADDDRAQVRATGGKDGSVTVNAGGDGAEIRTRRDAEDGVRRTYLLARDEPASGGWRKVGYAARGPVNGPLVIAVTRQRGDADEAFDDAEALVARNAGG